MAAIETLVGWCASNEDSVCPALPEKTVLKTLRVLSLAPGKVKPAGYARFDTGHFFIIKTGRRYHFWKKENQGQHKWIHFKKAFFSSVILKNTAVRSAAPYFLCWG